MFDRDLAVKESRHQQYEKFLTGDFVSTLKSAVKDRGARRDRDEKNKLFHPELDKLVKEEARTNKKVNIFFLFLLFSFPRYRW